MELEDNFGIQISDDDVEEIKTVADIVKYIDSHKQADDSMFEEAGSWLSSLILLKIKEEEFSWIYQV